MCELPLVARTDYDRTTSVVHCQVNTRSHLCFASGPLWSRARSWRL